MHFDNQNDVEMKRLNSVLISCIRVSLTWLSVGTGQWSQISIPRSHPRQERLLQLQAGEEEQGNEHGVALQQGGSLGMRGAVGHGWRGPSPTVHTPCPLVPFQFLQGCDLELCIRWQVLDKRIPLHANHKELLHKVSTLLGAYY